MNDIKNITDKIISDAQLAAEESEKNAREQAKQILATYREKADKLLKDAVSTAERESELVISRAQSSRKMSQRNMLLKAKCDILDEVFEKAAHQLCTLDSREYTDMLLSFFSQVQQPKNSIIFMNRKDLDSIGEDFFKKAKDIFEKNNPGYSLGLSENAVKISGGFILKSGDIELNCSLESCLGSFREKHENDIFKMLFD